MSGSYSNENVGTALCPETKPLCFKNTPKNNSALGRSLLKVALIMAPEMDQKA